LVTIFSPTEKHNPLTTKASDDQNVTECYVDASIPSEKLIMGPTPAGLGVVIRLSQHKNHRGVLVKAHVNDPADRLDTSALAMQLAVVICERLDLEEVTFLDNQSLVTTLQAHGNSGRRWVVKIPRSANKKAHKLAKQARQSLAALQGSHASLRATIKVMPVRARCYRRSTAVNGRRASPSPLYCASD
jgi:hypothetical protein